jgi:hypothetical protein
MEWSKIHKDEIEGIKALWKGDPNVLVEFCHMCQEWSYRLSCKEKSL